MTHGVCEVIQFNQLCIVSLAIVAMSAQARAVQTIQMNQVLNGAIDQPRLFAVVRPGPELPPLNAPGLGAPFDSGVTYSIEGFADTGAGTVLTGSNTASSFDIALDPGVIFTDVGVAGTDQFAVSQDVVFQLTHFDSDLAGRLDNLATIDQVYNQVFMGVRSAVGPRPEDPLLTSADPLEQIIAGLSEFNVFGTPLMKGKSLVMYSGAINDAAGNGEFKAFGDLLSSIGGDSLPELKSYLYDSPNAVTPRPPRVGPGFPVYDVILKTSYASFDAFTITSGGDPPALSHNPFIGADPVTDLNGGSTPGSPLPGVRVTHNGTTTEGSWLADTGAAATIWSQQQALGHGIAYSSVESEGLGGDNPTLIGVDLDDQFTLTLGGVGGELKVAGFFIEELILPAFRPDGDGGEQRVDLRFADAPILVADIDITHPVTQQKIILDGVLGVNFFFPTIFLDGDLFDDPFAVLAILDSPMITGNFDFVVFDEPTGQFLLSFNPAVIVQVLQGDTNNDGLVTGGDLIAVQQNFGNDYTNGACDGMGLGDANDDCLVTGADLITVQQNFGDTRVPAPVPESTTGLLLACIGLWLLPQWGGQSRGV